MRESSIVSETEVMAIPAPERTKTWVPVPHKDVINSITDACDNHGLDIINKNYTVAADGAKMFSSWTIDSGHEDRSWAFGFRNSTNKSMAIGMTAGTSIMVCSNMMFSGEYIAFRKHTGGLNLSELRWMADQAIEVTLHKAAELDVWHQGLKEIEMTKDECKIFTFDCMKNNVFAPSKFKAFGECVKEEYGLSKNRDLYTMHGGVTRLVRDTSLFQIADSTRKLSGVCDNFIEMKAA